MLLINKVRPAHAPSRTVLPPLPAPLDTTPPTVLPQADLLSETQRRAWARHLKAAGIDFLFWSAVQAQEDLEDEIR
jgi:hypothetical protein